MLFERLNLTCPSCRYAPWGAFIHSASIACSNVPDELVFRAEVAFCGGVFQTCDLSTHIEMFHSLVPAFLRFENRILLLDNNCPLYSGSVRSTECLTGRSSSTASLAGGVIGGIFAGVVLTLGIGAVVIAVIIFKCRNWDEDELNPHPKTDKFPKGEVSSSSIGTTEQRYANQKNQPDDPGYEFLPVFNKGPSGDETGELSEYDVPQLALSGLPEAPPPNAEYEVMGDLVPEKSRGKGKKGGSSKKKHAPQVPKSSKEQAQKKQKNTRRQAYENVDGSSAAEGPPPPPVTADKMKKLDASASRIQAADGAPAVNAKKKTTPAKGRHTEVGKGSTQQQSAAVKAPPLQTAAGKAPPAAGKALQTAAAESEEVDGFKAMRNKLAANIGGGATAVEASTKK
jgi:hypothetical protein